MIDKSEENTTKETSTVSKSELSDLLCLKYEYLVSYIGKQYNNPCNGRVFITIEKPMVSKEDVVFVEKDIGKVNNVDNCAIVSFQLLRTYEA